MKYCYAAAFASQGKGTKCFSTSHAGAHSSCVQTCTAGQCAFSIARDHRQILSVVCEGFRVPLCFRAPLNLSDPHHQAGIRLEVRATSLLLPSSSRTSRSWKTSRNQNLDCHSSPRLVRRARQSVCTKVGRFLTGSIVFPSARLHLHGFRQPRSDVGGNSYPHHMEEWAGSTPEGERYKEYHQEALETIWKGQMQQAEGVRRVLETGWKVTDEDSQSSHVSLDGSGSQQTRREGEEPEHRSNSCNAFENPLDAFENPLEENWWPYKMERPSPSANDKENDEVPDCSPEVLNEGEERRGIARPLVESIPYSVTGDPGRKPRGVLRKEPTGWLPGDPDIRSTARASGLLGRSALSVIGRDSIGDTRSSSRGSLTEDEDRRGAAALDAILERIRASGIIACVKADDSDVALQAARAALDASVSVLEIPLTTPAADEIIHTLVAEYPNALIGAGTVLGMLDAASVIKAGAKFLMSPGMDEHLVGWLKEGPALLIPGAMTPTELMNATRSGARAVKVFPVTAVGGVNFVKAMCRPFGKVPLIPAHGITVSMIEPYVTAGAVAVVLSDAIFDRAAMMAGDFAEISKRAASAAEEGRRAVRLRAQIGE
ncbi:hypothetical protein CBR_g30334 [Chara braunii]|uniref:KHG/KDPG aldolase n=1 Tax=Chara braunii TaxID=69332 RepID=A0A388JX49_CHABU|nr:hypothetical protein CBR_g30334 [Chara braunii]|eukprot:GBG62380.1 hypothetical protein CBR_g30334 [Chara braunii]